MKLNPNKCEVVSFHRCHMPPVYPSTVNAALLENVVIEIFGRHSVQQSLMEHARY